MTNPLVAKAGSSTAWYTGLGLAEDASLLADGIQNRSWVEGTLAGLGGSLDTLALVVDPLGSLVWWGAAWLMEHVQPLKEALDWLAGDPDQIAAHARTWRNVATYTAEARAQYQDAVSSQTADWLGESGDAYRAYAGAQLAAMATISRLAGGISYAVEGAGILVGAVRAIVRDLIAQFVATLAVRLPLWLAEEGVTLGLATPLVVTQVSTLVSTWVNRIRRFIQGLLDSLRRLCGLITRLGELLTEVRAMLRNLVRRSPIVAEAGAGRPRTSGWSGARYVEEVDPAAARAYERIRGDTGDVEAIARNLDVDPSVVDRVKQHLFVEEHDLPVGPGDVRRGNFSADERTADLWNKARNGSLSADETAEFKRLLSHEYVESRLMEQGMPYRSSDPAAYNSFGINVPSAEYHGAHDLAPLVDHQRDPFAHWPGIFGRTAPDTTIASDLSNLDDIVRAALGG